MTTCALERELTRTKRTRTPLVFQAAAAWAIDQWYFAGVAS